MDQDEIDNFQWRGPEQLTGEEFKQFLGFELILQNDISKKADTLMKKIIKHNPYHDSDDDLKCCNCKVKNGEKCVDETCFKRFYEKECPKECGEDCQNQPFRKEQWKTKLRMVHRPARGFSLVTMEAIDSDSFIMEYIGQVFVEEENPFYKKSFYCCSVRGDYRKQKLVVEPTLKGGFGRFLAHSNSPNCKLTTYFVDGKLRNVIIAKKHINPGSELVWDYREQYPLFGIHDCLCLESGCSDFKQALYITRSVISAMIAAATTPEVETVPVGGAATPHSTVNDPQIPSESEDAADFDGVVSGADEDTDKNEMKSVSEHDVDVGSEEEMEGRNLENGSESGDLVDLDVDGAQVDEDDEEPDSEENNNDSEVEIVYDSNEAENSDSGLFQEVENHEKENKSSSEYDESSESVSVLPQQEEIEENEESEAVSRSENDKQDHSEEDDEQTEVEIVYENEESVGLAAVVHHEEVIDVTEMEGGPENDDEAHSEAETEIFEFESVSKLEKAADPAQVMSYEEIEENEADHRSEAEVTATSESGHPHEAEIEETTSESSSQLEQAADYSSALAQPQEIEQNKEAEENVVESQPDSEETAVSNELQIPAESQEAATPDSPSLENEENEAPPESTANSSRPRKRKRVSAATPTKPKKKNKKALNQSSVSAQVSTRSQVAQTASEPSTSGSNNAPQAKKPGKVGRPKTRLPPVPGLKKKVGRPLTLPRPNLLCEECDITFATPQTLQFHIEGIHHRNEEKKHACESCSLKFRTSRDLANHRQIHLPDIKRTRFYCATCHTKRYRRKDVLKHQRGPTSSCEDKEPIRVGIGETFVPPV